MTLPIARLLSARVYALILLLFVSTALFGQTGSLALSSGSVALSGRVSLNLNWTAPATNAPAALQWTFSYTPGNVASLIMAAGPALTAAGKSLNCSSTSGTVICLASGMNTNTIGSGVVATATITLPTATTVSSIPIVIGNFLGVLPNGFNTPISGLSGTLTVLQPAPLISLLSPSVTLAGGLSFTLTVNGSGFTTSSVVKWNGSPRTTTFVSPTQLHVTITAIDILLLGIGQITVTNPAPGGGTSSSAALTISANNPVPTISSLSPPSGTVGGAAFTLTVNGSGFVNGSVVRWNGSNRTTTFVSATQLKASITAADIGVAGTGLVSVSTPAPGGGVSANASFIISSSNPVPTITSLSPPNGTVRGAAFTLTVNGSGFVNGSVVRWNGSNRTTTFVGATQLLAAITAADIATAGTGLVSVSTPAPGGGVSTNASFIINSSNPVPTITSLSPPSGTVGGAAFTLTVNGSGFVTGSVIRWKGSNRTTTFVSATQLLASIAAADINTVGTALVSVSTPAPGGGVSGNASFVISASNPVPTITSLSPASGAAGGPAFSMTVNGSGFVNSSLVRWNGSSRGTTFVSANQLLVSITAADISNAGTGLVSVSTPAPGGGISANAAFVISASNPVPTITSLSPASGAAGGPAFSMTVNGSGFVNSSLVRWNGSSRGTTFVSANQLLVSITAADISNAGTGLVSVSTPAPGGGISANAAFVISASNPVPTITSLSPASGTAGGPAFSMTVNGSGFVNGSLVRWNGSSRGTTFVSANQLLVSITAADISNAGTGLVSVSTPAPGGGVSANASFVINASRTTGLNETFETGAVGWTATGLWHLVNNSPCTASAIGTTPGYSSPTHAFYYGQDASCNYQTGTTANTGNLTSPPISGITIQSVLNFSYFLQTEGSPDADTATVSVLFNGISYPVQILSTNDPAWHSVSGIPLSPFAGQTIQVRFTFDTVTGLKNTFKGWFVDDVSINMMPGLPTFSTIKTNAITANSAVVTRTNPFSLAISAPTASASWTTPRNSLDLSGTVAGSLAVRQITWSNDRGGGNVATGTANWNIAGIPLHPGLNTITVVAHDGEGNLASASIAVTRSSRTVPTAVFLDSSGSVNLVREDSPTVFGAGGAFVSRPTTAQNANGDSYVAARDHFGVLWANVFQAASRTWGAWQAASRNTLEGTPGVTVSTDGTAYITARDNANAYWLTSYSPATGFADWTSLDKTFATDPAVASSPDGSILMVGKDGAGVVWSGRFVPGSGFQGWKPATGTWKGQPAVTVGTDGVAYVTARDNADSLWMARLQGERWLGWSYGGGTFSNDPQVVTLGNGTIAAVLADTGDGVSYRGYSEGTTNGWQGWTNIGGNLQTLAPMGMAGELYVAGLDSHLNVFWYHTPGNLWVSSGNTGGRNGTHGPASR